MAALSAFANITKLPDLRRRVGFTLVLLAVYRIGVFVTIPGVDRNVMQAVVHKSGSLLGLFNMFSGGALGNLSIFALGIMPYVSASIVLQLLTMVFKPLDELRKEGEQGQRKINQFTRYGTILLSVAQGFGIALQLEGYNNADLSAAARVGDVVAHPGWGFRFMTILTLTTGTAFMMWVGEQITERGVGNGISLIIFAGIVDGIPRGVFSYFETNKGNIAPLSVAIVLAIILLTVATIVFFERAQREIPIIYAKPVVGRPVYGQKSAHLPLKVNTAGTIPPIFASSLLYFPATLANFKIPGMSALRDVLTRGDWAFNAFYIVLIVFFCHFYTAVTFQPVDVADNLKKQNAFIPNLRPGKQTADYIDFVLTRITFGGSLYVAVVCVVPSVISQSFHIPFQWGGTSIMIVVGVALDTMSQIEAHLITRDYEGLSGGGRKASRVRGRRV